MNEATLWWQPKQHKRRQPLCKLQSRKGWPIVYSCFVSPRYRVVMMFTEAFPVGSANFAATSFDPNFSLVWQRRLSFSPKIISFTNWAHSSQVCIALPNSFSMFAMVVFMRSTVLGSTFGVLPRSCPHSNAFGTHAVWTGPGSSKQHLHNKRKKAKACISNYDGSSRWRFSWAGKLTRIFHSLTKSGRSHSPNLNLLLLLLTCF